MIRVRDVDQARELILRAMDRRWRVTVDYWEVRKDEQRRPVKGPDGEALMVHTVRTLEPFDVCRVSLAEYFDQGWQDTDYFTAMDACTAEGTPGIRAVRFDRITGVTIHKRNPYRMINKYFVGKVRQHAAQVDGDGWGEIAALTDDALWSLISQAWSADDAVEMAAVYANALETATT